MVTKAKLNGSTLNAYSLHVNLECVDLCFSVKKVVGFVSDNLYFVRTKMASNGCKRTLWKTTRTVYITHSSTLHAVYIMKTRHYAV